MKTQNIKVIGLVFICSFAISSFGFKNMANTNNELETNYVKNVRLEYGNTPQFDQGRKQVLQDFLNMDRIFKTDFFYKIYEKSARANIAAEISTLP